MAGISLTEAVAWQAKWFFELHSDISHESGLASSGRDSEIVTSDNFPTLAVHCCASYGKFATNAVFLAIYIKYLHLLSRLRTERSGVRISPGAPNDEGSPTGALFHFGCPDEDENYCSKKRASVLDARSAPAGSRQPQGCFDQSLQPLISPAANYLQAPGRCLR